MTKVAKWALLSARTVLGQVLRRVTSANMAV